MVLYTSHLNSKLQLSSVRKPWETGEITGEEYAENKQQQESERKRHTDRGVSSTLSVTWSAVPPSPQQGTHPGRVSPWAGVPPARSDGGTQGGVPLAGYTPLSAGVPPGRSDRGTRGGVPPWHSTSQQGYPSPPSGPGWGTRPIWTWSGTPSRCGQTDRHVSKHNLPVVLRMRSVKTGETLWFFVNRFLCKMAWQGLRTRLNRVFL